MSSPSMLILAVEYLATVGRNVATGDYHTVDQSLSSRSGYGDELIRTLSSNGALAAADGFLFVPDIDKRDCEVQAGVPSNVTRLSDIPLPANVGAVAVAPWTSAECATKYLAAARAVAGLRALIFYLPDPNLDSQHPFPTNGPLTIPPVASDPVWGLGDGGRWKGDNGYPVYALPSPAGVDLMQQLSSYSGNITQLPHGPELLKTYGSDGNVKLYIQIDTGLSASLPNLWVFLLIVLSILAGVVVSTSLFMHWLQYRRRQILRRRIAAGDIDLELLGIKKCTVPQSLINEIPKRLFESATEVKAAAVSTPGDDIRSAKQSTDQLEPARKLSTTMEQPTCAICLEDYEPAKSIVRELHCYHIFHPECIDPFLRNNSSLCPLCKQTVLKPGTYEIRVTNAIVRRERRVRRQQMRRRELAELNAAAAAATSGQGPEQTQGQNQRQASRMGRLFTIRIPLPTAPLFLPGRGSGRFSQRGNRVRGPEPDCDHHQQQQQQQPRVQPADSTSTAVASSTPAVEMTHTTPASVALPASPAPVASAAGRQRPQSEQLPQASSSRSPSRRENWRRDRALALLGTSYTAPDADEEESRRASWRKVVGVVFPGFH